MSDLEYQIVVCMPYDIACQGHSRCHCGEFHGEVQSTVCVSKLIVLINWVQVFAVVVPLLGSTLLHIEILKLILKIHKKIREST